MSDQKFTVRDLQKTRDQYHSAVKISMCSDEMKKKTNNEGLY